MAALVAATHYGVPAEVAGDLLERFQGVHRRFEHKGTVRDVLVYDDYAHHPTEIRATLAAARAQYPDRAIWAVFQPHTYSRTLALMDEFAVSFEDADHVIITDIFAAREREDLGVHASTLAGRIDHGDAKYLGSLREVADWVCNRLRPGMMLLTLGAGNVYQVGDMVLATLRGAVQ
jgi:UDP-N-acetylmuramate--alanine ligase